MPGLYFVNILRMVSPGNPLRREDLDFYTLGNFDAIRIENTRIEEESMASLRKLHETNKQMHLDIPVHYDKQLLYLYSADYDAQKKIFDIHAENAVKPLVLTLIQLDDFRLKLDAPEDVIGFFEDQVGKMVHADKEFSGIEYQAFYSLGESDVALVLRHERIEPMGRLLFRMRLLEDKEKGIHILSMCSHCAFPNAADEVTLRNNFETWLKRDAGLRFFTLTDTSYGLNNNWDENKSDFVYPFYLLGEWDYCKNWAETDHVNNATECVRHVLHLMHDPDATQITQILRTAYTVPMIPLHGEDKKYAKSQQKLVCIQADYIDLLRLYEGKKNEKTSFETLANKVTELSDMYGEEFCDELSDRILSMRKTLTGIVKHLLNLKDGRFQQDLFAFLQPIFRMLPVITDDICQLVMDYHTIPTLKKSSLPNIANLLDTYILDTSRLLSELQHLFSVLSVSPHTFLETYGSNMRSIAATCKLLVAYQGIVNNISSHFDMTLDTPLERKKVNEVMIVLPYRSIRQSTRVLYEKAHPYNRVAYIRINSSDMFDIPKTLFLLLHECGHNVLSNDFRKERMRYYFQAVIGSLVDISFSEYFLHTFSAMGVVLSDESEYEKRKSSPEYQVRKTSPISIRQIKEDIINSKIRDSFLKICMDEADRMCIEWENELKNQDKYNNPFIDLYHCDFFAAIMPYAMNYIDHMLGYSSSPKDASSHYRSVEDLVEDLLGENVFRVYVSILKDELFSRKHDNDRELWALNKLYATYLYYIDNINNPHLLIRRMAERASKLFQKNYEMACNEIRAIFSDIYSDMFAFYMLRLDKLNQEEKQYEAKRYIRLLLDQAGFRMNDEIVNAFTIVRVLIVLICCYEIPAVKAIDFFISNLPLNIKTIDKIKDNCSAAINSIYFTFIESYAKNLCRNSILEQRDTHPFLGDDTHWLHTMYTSSKKEKLKETISSIHHFWMNSTQR